MVQEEKVINFMAWRTVALSISAVLLLASVVSLGMKGLSFGLDFTGGTQLEVGFEEPADLPKIRAVLGEAGLENPVAVLFGSDTEVLIRTQLAMEQGGRARIEGELNQFGPNAQLLRVNRAPADKTLVTQTLSLSGVTEQQLKQANIFPEQRFGRVSYESTEEGISVAVQNSLDIVYTQYLLDALGAATSSTVELRRSEFVGPQVGAELRDQGGLGMLFALFVVMAYVAVRFQYKFSVGAVLALIHDVIIVIGFFSLLELEFDLTVLAAVLAVIGYSINDTIVVFDRIRENFRKVRRGTTEEVINISLTQTFERTMITSLTTLLVLVVLFFMGGELIRGFSIALIVGIVIGTLSSIYISSNFLLISKLTKEDLMPPQKEGEEQEELVP